MLKNPKPKIFDFDEMLKFKRAYYMFEMLQSHDQHKATISRQEKRGYTVGHWHYSDPNWKHSLEYKWLKFAIDNLEQKKGIVDFGGFARIMSEPKDDIFIYINAGAMDGTIGVIDEIDFNVSSNNPRISYTTWDPQWTGGYGKSYSTRAANCEFSINRYSRKDTIHINNSAKRKTRTGYRHFNAFGQELALGSKVIFCPKVGGLGYGEITKITRTSIKISVSGGTKEMESLPLNVFVLDKDSEMFDQLVFTKRMTTNWNGMYNSYYESNKEWVPKTEKYKIV